MSDPSQKKFEARVGIALWDRYEQWAEGRGRIDNAQLMTALLKLFLAAPEGVKLLSLYGRDDQLASAAEVRADLLAAGIVSAALADVAGRRETPARSPAESKRSAKPPDRDRKTG